jgi:hypothetical protein
VTYFWLTIQNTTIPQVRNLFSVIAVFISFSGGTESMAVRPRTAWFLAALKYFLKKRKENKKRKKGKKKKNGKRTKTKGKKRRVPRRAISAGHRVQEHNPSCCKWARRGEESKLSSLLYDPLCACSHGISRKEQRMRGFSVLAVVNVRERKHAGVRVYHSE